MAADYRHIGGVENRLGRHYSRFSPFSPTPALADQSLARRKLWNAGSNRRSRVKMLKQRPPTVQFLVKSKLSIEKYIYGFASVQFPLKITKRYHQLIS